MGHSLDLWRIPILVLVLAGVATWDRLRHGPGSLRWREYLFILLGGGLGALFGGATDFLVTSRLSPEYFQFGKGIPPGSGFLSQVALLGLQAGFGPGALCGVVYVALNTWPVALPRLPWSRVAKAFVFPIFGASVIGALLAVFFGQFDPYQFRTFLSRVFEPDQVLRFIRVWWIHSGLYLGSALGLALGACRVHWMRSEKAILPTDGRTR